VSDPISRRDLIARGAAAALAAAGVPTLLRAAAGTPMLVYKDPGCGCCENWVTLMTKAGFEVAVHNTTDMNPIKKRYQVAEALISCHTALVAGYVIEGHVPADLIRKVMAEKPRIVGLAVPGMIVGTPGMEGARKEPYAVLAFDAAGKTTVYARR
jgi:hypothetical protein